MALNQRSSHRIRLVSSNPRKLEAFRLLGLDVDLMPGVDLPEVDGTPDEVAIRKAEAAGEGTLVEDTVLYINGAPVVDIKWHIAELDKYLGASVLFVVTLACNDGESIYLWRGGMRGTIGPNTTVEGDSVFGFDPWVYPDDAGGLSLHELHKLGRTAEFSARARAARSYLHDAPFLAVVLADLPAWTGQWQNDDGGVSKPPAP